jgi:hypothetical protein
MILGAANHRARLKHHGRRIVVREKYQRPEVKDLGTKWRMVYWDYSSKPRRKRSKVWGKQTAPSKREAQRLADQFMEKVTPSYTISLHPAWIRHSMRESCRRLLDERPGPELLQELVFFDQLPGVYH